MVTAGLILLALALFLPAVVAVSPVLTHGAAVLGVILVVVGVILYLGARADRPWGRRLY